MLEQTFKIPVRTKPHETQTKQFQAFIGCSGNVWAGQTLAFLLGQKFLWAINVWTT
jgi:hypothetical protein